MGWTSIYLWPLHWQGKSRMIEYLDTSKEIDDVWLRRGVEDIGDILSGKVRANGFVSHAIIHLDSFRRQNVSALAAIEIYELGKVIAAGQDTGLIVGFCLEWIENPKSSMEYRASLTANLLFLRKCGGVSEARWKGIQGSIRAMCQKQGISEKEMAAKVRERTSRDVPFTAVIRAYLDKNPSQLGAVKEMFPGLRITSGNKGWNVAFQKQSS